MHSSLDSASGKADQSPPRWATRRCPPAGQSPCRRCRLRRPARFSNRRAAGSARRSAASRGSARWWPTSCRESSGFWCSSRRQLISCCSKDIQHLLAVVSLPPAGGECSARWPVAMGVSMMSSSNCSSACSASSRGFDLFRVPEIGENPPAGNARRSAAGLAGEKRRPAPHCRRSARWPFSSSTPHTSTCCASAAAVAGSSATTTWTATIASRGLSSRQRLNTARRSALSPLRWAAKTKFQSRRAAQFSALRLAPSRKPSARRGGIGVARRPLLSRAQSATASYPAAPADRQRSLLLLMQALLQGAGGERQAARRLADPRSMRPGARAASRLSFPRPYRGYSAGA